MIEYHRSKICLRHYDSVWSIDNKPDSIGLYHWNAIFFVDKQAQASGSTFDLSLGLHQMIAARNQYYHSSPTAIKVLQ